MGVDLPWPALAIPPLPRGRFGDWEIVDHPVRRIRGYFCGVQDVTYMNVTLKRDGVTWMSLAPMELESQRHHVAASRGHTLVGGGGLGIALYNILARPEVEHVTLIERDPQVLELLRVLWQHAEWPGIDKLHAIEGDLLEPHVLAHVNFAYLDIWPTLGNQAAVPDCQRFQAWAQADELGWWGMEIAFYRWAREHGFSRQPGEDAWHAWTTDLRLPLLQVENHWEWAERAARNFLRQYPPPEYG